MKVLSKLALFTALVVLSACAVAETPFKVYADKDKSFKQIEKMLAGKSTKWENKQTANTTDSAGNASTFDTYSRVYTYDNDNFATASFQADPNELTRSDYQTYTHKKLSVDGYTATYGGSGGTAFDVAGYTIYELTPGPGGSASTSSPRAIRKQYTIIKIDGSTLSAFDSVEVDVDAKTITLWSPGVPAPTVYNKL